MSGKPVTAQPTAGVPRSGGPNGQWKANLFDVDFSSCCKAFCCPCLIAKDVGQTIGKEDGDDVMCGWLWCVGYLCAISSGWVVSTFLFLLQFLKILRKKTLNF